MQQRSHYQLNHSQLQQVSGGCVPHCVPADRRPMGPIVSNYNPAELNMTAPADWRMPPPQPFWPIDAAQ
ncbi:MAG: hypothetical protein AB8B93_10640 [Pseudomonadales bacterium]